MKKYLCLIDYQSGICKIANVGSVKAYNEEEAREMFRRMLGLTKEAINYIQAYEVGTLYDGWMYYS